MSFLHKLMDFVTSDLPTGRPYFSIQNGRSASDSVVLRILDSNGNVVICLNADGEVEAKTILLNNLPTSASGLPSGAVWNSGGTLKIA